MNGLLHLSDTHFGTERPEVVRGLLALVQARRPRLVVLSGDITQRATAAQFAAARRFVDALACPARVVVPGNHDIPLFALATRLVAPYRRYSRAFDNDLQPQYADADLLVSALNTTRWWRHVNGEVSAAQTARSAACFAGATRRQLRVVVVHQPVAVTLPEDRRNLLRGHAAAVQAWARQGVDLVLGGHIHLPYWVALHERVALPRPLWAVQAGTAVSHRLRPGTENSVHELGWDTAGQRRLCRLTQWDWDPRKAAFAAAAAAELPLGV